MGAVAPEVEVVLVGAAGAGALTRAGDASSPDDVPAGVVLVLDGSGEAVCAAAGSFD